MWTHLLTHRLLARRRLAVATLLAGLPAARAMRARAADAPIRLVIPFAPGGPNQAMAAIVAEGMQAALGRPVVIENRPSSRGSVGGAEFVARAPADGTTLLVTQQSHLLNAFLFPGLSFDPIDSFAPVALLAEAPLVVLVPAQGAPRSMADLAARLRRPTGEERYGSGGPATGTQIASQLLVDALGAQATHVPFNGLGPARAALVAGRLTFLLDVAPSALADAAAGRVRPLAVLSGQRLAALPDVPTMNETGLVDGVGLLGAIWNVLLAPAGTPAETVAVLNAAADQALAAGAVQVRLAAMGARGMGGFSPAATRVFLQAESMRLEKLAQRALSGE